MPPPPELCKNHIYFLIIFIHFHFYLRNSASALAGVVAATVSLPPDNIKTKIMKMKPDANGQLPYKGFVDCMMKVKNIYINLNK